MEKGYSLRTSTEIAAYELILSGEITEVWAIKTIGANPDDFKAGFRAYKEIISSR